VGVEAQKVVAFVFDALLADTGVGGVSTLLGGRIYRDQVPQSAALPAATVTLVASTDSSTLGGNRVLDIVLVDVRCVAAGSSYGPISAAADRVDSVLQNSRGVNSGVVVVELRRDQTQAFVENEAGTQYAHLIQTFRTEAYAAS
jgi:hypothetical protein